MSEGSSFDDVVSAARDADLTAEAERLKRERAEREAWLAKSKDKSQYNIGQLLEKMVGSEPTPAAPAPAPKVEEKPNDKPSKFPPPPRR